MMTITHAFGIASRCKPADQRGIGDQEQPGFQQQRSGRCSSGASRPARMSAAAHGTADDGIDLDGAAAARDGLIMISLLRLDVDASKDGATRTQIDYSEVMEAVKSHGSFRMTAQLAISPSARPLISANISRMAAAPPAQPARSCGRRGDLARHLSSSRPGRAPPSRDMCWRLAERLEVPCAAQCALVAGFARIFPQVRWDGSGAEPSAPARCIWC